MKKDINKYNITEKDIMDCIMDGQYCSITPIRIFDYWLIDQIKKVNSGPYINCYGEGIYLKVRIYYDMGDDKSYFLNDKCWCLPK